MALDTGSRGKRVFVKPKRNGILLIFILSSFCLTFFLPAISFAQMRAGYPRQFHLTGLVELVYRNYNNTSSYRNREYSAGFSNFQQRVKLALEGYVYHPRLIVFTTSVDFANFKSLSGAEIDGRDLAYDIDVVALPYRPVSLELFAARSHNHFVAATAALPDWTTNHYGALLKINLVKIQPPGLVDMAPIAQ